MTRTPRPQSPSLPELVGYDGAPSVGDTGQSLHIRGGLGQPLAAKPSSHSLLARAFWAGLGAGLGITVTLAAIHPTWMHWT